MEDSVKELNRKKQILSEGVSKLVQEFQRETGYFPDIDFLTMEFENGDRELAQTRITIKL